MRISFLRTIKSDLEACKVIPPHSPPGVLRIIKHAIWGISFRPNFACVFMYRVNRVIYLKKLPGRDLFAAWRYYQFANDISFMADIGPGLRIVHVSDIVIGGGVTIGSNATIFNGVSIGAKHPQDKNMPRLGDNVRIGTGTKIIGNIVIEDNVQIGALSLINKSIPSDSTVWGIPPNVTLIQDTRP